MNNARPIMHPPILSRMVLTGLVAWSLGIGVVRGDDGTKVDLKPLIDLKPATPTEPKSAPVLPPPLDSAPVVPATPAVPAVPFTPSVAIPAPPVPGRRSNHFPGPPRRASRRSRSRCWMCGRKWTRPRWMRRKRRRKLSR